MEEDNKTPLTDYYSKPYQGKQYRENNTESMIVPAAIKLLAWVCLVCGIPVLVLRILFRMFEDGVWIYGLESVAASVFLFGFSAIVKAAYKYLDD